MIRATTLLIVLTFTGTPTATSMCIAWCDAYASPGTMAAGCHHTITPEGTPRLVAGAHECDELLQAVPLVTEDLQRVASGSALDHTVVMAHDGLGGWESDDRPLTSAWGQPHLFRPPDSTVLRL